MDFKPNYPIYLQVADFICEKLLTGIWHDGDKLPAVKDLAVMTSVNPNTVIKALTHLQDNEILTTQRGIGYFMTENARTLTLVLKRSQFIEQELPQVFANMKLLGLSMTELNDIHRKQGGNNEHH